MTEVKVFFKLDKVLQLVHELRADGLVQGVDFNFIYNQKRDSFFEESNQQEPTHTVFEFTDDMYAMMFQLKHGS